MMEERIEETFETGPQAEVSVENVRGAVTVTAWDEARVHVVARRRGERARVIVTGDGPRVTARTEIEPRDKGIAAWFSREEPAEVEYDVRVPRGSQVWLKTVSGSIRVSGVQNTVEATSVDGSVMGADLRGVVRAQATNGTVELTNVTGQAQAYTTNGTVALRGGHLDDITAETVNGAIIVDPLNAGSEVRARTVNGELRLSVPPAVAVDLDASGVMLRAQIDGPSQPYETSRTAWRGTIGQGQPNARVSYRTVNGRVQVNGRGAVGQGAGQAAGEMPQPTPPTFPTPPTPPTPPAPPSAEAGAPASPTVAASAPAAEAPRDVMSILAAIERGELKVEDALELMKKANG